MQTRIRCSLSGVYNVCHTICIFLSLTCTIMETGHHPYSLCHTMYAFAHCRTRRIIHKYVFLFLNKHIYSDPFQLDGSNIGSQYMFYKNKHIYSDPLLEPSQLSGSNKDMCFHGKIIKFIPPDFQHSCSLQ